MTSSHKLHIWIRKQAFCTLDGEWLFSNVVLEKLLNCILTQISSNNIWSSVFVSRGQSVEGRFPSERTKRPTLCARNCPPLTSCLPFRFYAPRRPPSVFILPSCLVVKSLLQFRLSGIISRTIDRADRFLSKKKKKRFLFNFQKRLSQVFANLIICHKSIERSQQWFGSREQRKSLVSNLLQLFRWA